METAHSSKIQESDSHEEGFEKSQIMMWFLLLVVFMTFAGLISAYLVLSANNALEWHPFKLPNQVWLSTAIIIISSFTYYVADKSLRKNDFKASRIWFLATTALGATFISSQILVWYGLVGQGLYFRGNPYAGFFYILTATHAIHVLGGIFALAYILLKTWRLRTKISRKLTIESSTIGLYWHTMGGLWLILIYLLGFWKS